MLRSEPTQLWSLLRPVLTDQKFQDLKIFCQGGKCFHTSKILFASLLPDFLRHEMALLDNLILTDSDMCIILPDISISDISHFFDTILEPSSDSSWSGFDVEKFKFFNFELFSSNTLKHSPSNRKNVKQFSKPSKSEINSTENETSFTPEFVSDTDSSDLQKKSPRGKKKKNRLVSELHDFVEWDYSTKVGHCKVCGLEFDKDPRRLQRHVERSHLGRGSHKKFEKKILLRRLINFGEDDGNEDNADPDKSIGEVMAELRDIQDEEKRKKIQARLDELTASEYKLGKTGRLYKKEQCAICGKTLCSKYALKKHEESVHLNIRHFACDICSKRFIMKNDLRDHITAVHHKIKSCVCDICGLKLATHHGLRVHKLIHQDDTKSIQCSQCEKSFRHMCTYRRHFHRVHDFTPEKRIKCDACGKFFNHHEGLSTHVKKFHTPQAAVFKCHLCKATFAFRYDRSKHLRRQHKMDKSLVQTLSNLEDNTSEPAPISTDNDLKSTNEEVTAKN